MSMAPTYVRMPVRCTLVEMCVHQYIRLELSRRVADCLSCDAGCDEPSDSDSIAREIRLRCRVGLWVLSLRSRTPEGLLSVPNRPLMT